MSGKKRRKRKKAKAQSNQDRPSRWPVIAQIILARGSRFAAWILVIGIIVGGVYFGVPRLQAFAIEQTESTPVHIRFVNPPQWFHGAIDEAVTRTVQANVGSNPFRQEDLVAVRESLLTTGWFDVVEQVRRSATDEVVIRAQFVRPFALVRDRDGDHLIDRAGRLLPKSYDHGSNPLFIDIRGAQYVRPARTGRIWEGADVRAAIRLVHEIRKQPWRDQIRSIDISGYLRDRPIKMLTDADTTIIWGAAPGEEQPLEALLDEKLRRLNFLYERHGRIDAGNEGEVDISGPKVVVTR